MNRHLEEQEIIALLMDKVTLPSGSQGHLAECEACQASVAAWQHILQDFAMLKATSPSPAALERYLQLYQSLVKQEEPQGVQAALRGWWQTVSAALVWDSRLTLAHGGVRAGAQQEYRLLFSTDAVEIELWVSGQGNSRHVEGEYFHPAGQPTGEESKNHPVLQGNQGEQSWDSLAAPVLVQLEQDGVAAYEAESTSGGRFKMMNVEPGLYRLVVVSTPSLVTVEALEIT
jgi:hypothetical protein